MSRTNIHQAMQLLGRAGMEQAVQAQIMPFNKAVYIIGRDFTQEELDEFAEALHGGTRQRNKWYEYGHGSVQGPVGNDRGLPVPSLYLSPGLRNERSYGVNVNEDEEKVELAYVIVVRGASAAKMSKVRVFYSRFAVAAGIMEEALQGWSVVFSAAMLKRDLPSLDVRGVHLEKVESVSELRQAAGGEVSSETVLLCC